MYPFIHLADGLEIPSFFLVISFVLSIALIWVTRRASERRLPPGKILDLSLLLMGASLLGSRLMHVLYENFDYYKAEPKKIFFLWDGGFVFFGGAFLAFAAGLLYLHLTKTKDRGVYFDTFAPVLAFAYSAGRFGCFLAGCCYGRACELPWAVQGRHPTQLYALFWEAGALLVLLGLEKIPAQNRSWFLQKDGSLFLLWVAMHSLGRILMESFRDDFRGQNIFGISISSFLSVLLIVVGVTLLARSRKREHHGKL